MGKKYLIIGIDPGHTIGICALNLSGEIVHLVHLEQKGIEDTVATISNWGTPSLIACDVKPAPSFAIKLASYFGVKLHVPSKDIREDEKRAILKHIRTIKKTNLKLGETAHERDALAAAIKAWRYEQNTIRSVFASKLSINASKQKLVHLVLGGMSLSDAIHSLSVNKLIKKKTFSSQKKVLGKISTSSKREKDLIRVNEQLRLRINSLEKRNSILSHEMEKLKRGSEQSLLRDSQIRKLNLKLSRFDERLSYFKAKYFALLYSKKIKRKKKIKKNIKHISDKKTESLKDLNSIEKLDSLIREYRKGRH